MGLSLGLLVLVSTPAFAYTLTLIGNGTTVKWPGTPHLNLAGNPTNQSGISATDFNTAVVTGLQRWKKASGGAIGFDYWQGTDKSIYEPSSEFNGLSSIFFVSNANSNPGLSAQVLGLTQVWYNTTNGQILETDIALNDLNFRFTMNPADTTGSGSSHQTGAVYIENVITHEIGHAYGLSHSAGLQSTMLFSESPEQAHLGCDEQVAIHSLYPSSDAGSRGSISGNVVSDAGTPVFGANVIAISQGRGTVLASALTDSSGRYSIQALEAGPYYLMVEPYYAPVSSLPTYYGPSNSNLCGGKNFSRSVLADSSGYNPSSISVPRGGNVSAPKLNAHCANSGAAAIAGAPGSSSIATAPVIYTGGPSFGVVDEFKNSGTLYYQINTVSGALDIHVMSYSLYSKARATLTLLDSNREPVNAKVDTKTYEGDSGYINYDSRLTTSALPAGNYVIQVEETGVFLPQSYPGGSEAQDQSPFMFLMGTVNAGNPTLAAVIPTNPRCRMNESFTAYSSPPGGPPRSSTQTSSSGTGFCGSIQKVSERGGKGPSSPSAGAAVGWILPWAFMGLWVRVMRRLRLRALLRTDNLIP